jgi:hypothetical protein
MSPLFQQNKVYVGSSAASAAYLGSVLLFTATPAVSAQLQMVINTEADTASNTAFNVRSKDTALFDIDWGDGNVETAQNSNLLLHTYSSPGVYTVTITSDSGFIPYNNNRHDDARQVINVSWPTSVDFPFGTELLKAWHGCRNMTSFDLVDTSSVESLSNTWNNCSSLTSFPLIDTSSVTSFFKAWYKCESLTSFPLIDVSSASTLNTSWNFCSQLATFPLIDTSSISGFNLSWSECSALTSFPLIDTSSATYFTSTWKGCTSLTTFPANMFDTTGTLTSTAFSNAFTNCALSAQSIENILTSLDTNGQSNVSLNLNGGTNAPRASWSAAANTAYGNLIGKGWSISYN